MTDRYGVIFVSIVMALLIVAPKATVAALVLAVGGLGAAAWRYRSEAVLGDFLDNRFVIGAIVGIAIVAFASSSWYFLDGPEYQALSKVVLILVVGVLAVSAVGGIPDTLGRVVHNGSLTGYTIGFLVILIAAAAVATTGESLWGSYYYDPLTTLNNSAVMLALLFWQVAYVAFRCHDIKLKVVLLLAVALVALLPSAAAFCTLIVGCLVLIVRRFAGPKGGMALAYVAALLILTAPNVMSLLDAERFMTSEYVNHSSSVPYSARHRLAMWSFAVEKIDEKPWLGWGFGSSRHIPQEDRRLAPNMEIMPLHPHNLALQTRLELGLPGVLILAALVFTVFYRLATFTDDPWKSGIAMAAASGWLFVANVSYGMWQSWWIALAFLLAVLMKISFYVQPTKREIRD